MDVARAGHRRTGRPKTSWLDSITAGTGVPLESALCVASDRDEWRRQVCDAVHPRLQND